MGRVEPTLSSGGGKGNTIADILLKADKIISL